MANYSSLEDWKEVSKLDFQVFRYFNVVLNVSKQLSVQYFFLVFQLQVNVSKASFSDTILHVIGCFVVSTTRYSHYTGIELFFCIIPLRSRHRVLFSYCHVWYTLQCKRDVFLDNEKAIRASHCFKNSVGVWKKPSTKKRSFFVCLAVVSNCTVWLCSLRKGHGHTFKTTGLVLSRCETTRL